MVQRAKILMRVSVCEQQQPSSALTSPNVYNKIYVANTKEIIVTKCLLGAGGPRENLAPSSRIVCVCARAQWNFEWKADFFIIYVRDQEQPWMESNQRPRFDTWRMKQVISRTIKFDRGGGSRNRFCVYTWGARALFLYFLAAGWRILIKL